MGVALIGLVATVTYALSLKFVESKNVVLFMANVFFVLLNSYYGGTMTMYFASGEKDPFSNLANALEQYPTWDMVIVHNSFFTYKAMDGLKLTGINDWVKRAETSPQTYLLANEVINYM